MTFFTVIYLTKMKQREKIKQKSCGQCSVHPHDQVACRSTLSSNNLKCSFQSLTLSVHSSLHHCISSFRFLSIFVCKLYFSFMHPDGWWETNAPGWPTSSTDRDIPGYDHHNRNKTMPQRVAADPAGKHHVGTGHLSQPKST